MFPVSQIQKADRISIGLSSPYTKCSRCSRGSKLALNNDAFVYPSYWGYEGWWL